MENRLVSASGAKNATLRYDPMGRLFETTGGTEGLTRFAYDGDALVQEFTISGSMRRRYVHGTDAGDDPIAWFEGSGFTDDTQQRLLRTDQQGSIVAVADATSAAIIAVNTYDEYGLQSTANQGRFQYTGQTWMVELGLYYYKARMYSPKLGRFMQTDPIGYDDDLNLYEYVADDPVNEIDPSGTESAGYSICGDATCNRMPEEVADAIIDILPGVSDYEDAAETIENPTPGNIASEIADVVPALKLFKTVKKVANVLRRGKEFTKLQRAQFFARNAAKNKGKITCIDCDRRLKKIASKKGRKTPRNQAQLHHDPPIMCGGGRHSKACVVCPECHKRRH